MVILKIHFHNTLIIRCKNSWNQCNS